MQAYDLQYGYAMDPQLKQSFIREKALQNDRDPQGTRILWSRHAITELVADDLTRRQVEGALQECELIGDYPTLHRPLPDCLVLGWLTATDPLHAVVAIDQQKDRILIVTVYRPNEEEWEHDWRTRRA
jgi:hypothetical protein